jgi:hypothetical protein
VAAAEQRLCSGGKTGRGVLGFGAALAWGMGFLGVAGWFKEGTGDLGVRAQEGNRRDSRAGKTSLARGPGLSVESPVLWANAAWVRRVGQCCWASARGGKLGRAGGAGRGEREMEGKGWAASV